MTDASGTRTSFGYDSAGRIRCIVYNDNDGEAFADPQNPDTSACAGPTSSQVVRIDSGELTTTTTRSSLLGDVVTDVETRDPVTLQTTSRVTTGFTRDIDGTIHAEAHRSTMTYDSLGRITARNGPLNDEIAYDVVETSYYTTSDATWPYNFGNVQQATRYVGSSSSRILLTITYAEYDIFGTPHRITVRTESSSSTRRPPIVSPGWSR